ncbi:site-specific DNA-methyltransferase [Enterococcus lactis]|uniref:site-specific DNA-methyltransferase n=1 Tax=Enterococcus TaxID=1350 RepID=UPI00288E1B62|nr:site-specific DNA-methyltransferase [Enterococcus lactis]EME8139945.1 site-specific DNA-methyltransferase [Enterococcus faecium]MDT2793008.1 site-specific DNA-methyltransferase [Enterococcus lactis]
MTNERTNERLEEVSSHSLDITEQNIEKLKELFPEVLTEKKIDFDKLRLILGDEIETAPERYNFTWNGKKQVMQLAQQPTVATLKPNKAKSKNWDETQNLYIEGDNLEVLKILQKSYANKVKLIYLDPPYNTGKDFIYRDNFHDSIENYLEQTGQVDNEGNKLSVNTETSGRYHTNWLNMMYPRLKLARNLLSDDGVIFVSIGTVEQENLSRLFDEIFGENNRVGIVPVIMNLKGNQDAYGFADTHEYVLVYAKSKDNLDFGRLPIDDEEMNDWLEDEYGLYKVADNLRATGVNAPRSKRPNLWYPIFVTSNDELYVTEDNEPLSNDDEIVMPINPEGEELSWYWGKATFNESKHNLIVKRTSNGTQFYRKQRPALGADNPTKKAKSVLFKPEYSSSTATTKLKDLLGGKLFDFPKPVPFIEDLISLGTNKDSIVLDFFSGSGTTAEAVFKKNMADDGNRKFILAQLPEQIPEGSNAKRAGYNTIPELAMERISKAGEQILKERPSEIGKLDIGFKVFELSKSNIKKWNAEPKDLNEQFELLANNFEEGSKPIDVVYEIMLKQGLDLTYPISEIKVGDAVVYDIAFGAMFVVLGDKITSEVAGHIMKQIADEEAENSVVVLQDEKFINDSEKLNTIEQLNASGIQYNDILSI